MEVDVDIVCVAGERVWSIHPGVRRPLITCAM